MEDEIEAFVSKAVEIPEIRHDGEIVQLHKRETQQGYLYLDIFIMPDDVEMKTGIRHSVPLTNEEGKFLFSKNSKLGRLLLVLGVELVEEQSVKLKEILLGKRLSFLSRNRKTDRGTFAEIDEESLAPPKNAVKTPPPKEETDPLVESEGVVK